MTSITLLIALIALVEGRGISEVCYRECPELSEFASISEERNIWVCEQIRWRCNLYAWAQKFVPWWSTCVESDVNPAPFQEPECPELELFECCGGRQDCDEDSFGCTICRCLEGKFKYPSRLTSFWKKDNARLQEILNTYEHFTAVCTPRSGNACGSNVTTTDSAPTRKSNVTATPYMTPEPESPDMGTPSNSSDGPFMTPEPESPDMGTPSNSSDGPFMTPEPESPDMGTPADIP